MSKVQPDQWKSVNWALPNTTIAAALDVSYTAVLIKRAKLGIPPYRNVRSNVPARDLVAMAELAETPPIVTVRPVPELRQVVTVLTNKNWSVPQIARWIKDNNPAETRSETRLRRYVSGVLYKMGRKG